MKLVLEAPLNSLSFGNVAFNLIRELHKKGVDLHQLSAFDLLKYYADSRLTNAESIRRMRAKLQEQHIELRGKKYNLRKTTIQNKVRKELGYEAY